MNSRLAAAETLRIIRENFIKLSSWPELPTPVRDSKGLRLSHLHWMLLELQTGEFSEGKAGRWLGWIQAILTTKAILTLSEAKQINKACSCEDKGCPHYNTPHIHQDS